MLKNKYSNKTKFGLMLLKILANQHLGLIVYCQVNFIIHVMKLACAICLSSFWFLLAS